MTTIYLIRHAEAEGNLYRRIHGSYDSLVTERGYVQIEALRRRFRDVPVDAVWSSDCFRTMTTARAIYEPKGLPLHTDPELREMSMGLWEDRPWGEKGYFERAELRRFNDLEPDWHAPGGEDRIQLGARMERAMERIARSCPGGTAAVFSHGTAIQQFIACVRRLPPDQWRGRMIHSDNTAVSCLSWDGTRFTVVYDGDNSHLDERSSTLAEQHWWRADSTLRDVNLWYRPIDWQRERELYLQACRDVPDAGADDGQRERQALASLSESPWAVSVAMDEGTPVGVIRMDSRSVPRDGAGVIAMCCILPEFRRRKLGVQLIGQAVSYFRPMGCDRLRLYCPAGRPARRFFETYGFRPAAGPGMMEKQIGYGR